MKSILLTRSATENEGLKKKLEGNDFHYVDCPLIEYEDLEFDPQIMKNYSTIIITSKHGAKIVDGTTLTDNTTSAYVIGQESAVILSKKGFDIRYIAANINDLIEHLPKNEYSTMLYLSADIITKSLPEEIKRHIIYRVRYLERLNFSLLAVIKGGIDYILLYSQNCASTLLKLLNDHNLIKRLENTIIVAISLKVANIVKPYFTNVIYCGEGESEQMIGLLLNDKKNRR